jgi:hypothetical protein
MEAIRTIAGETPAPDEIIARAPCHDSGARRACACGGRRALYS